MGLLLDVWGHVAGSGLQRRVSLLVLAFALTSKTAMTTVQWSLSFHCKLCSHAAIAPSNHGRVRAVPVIHELPIRRSHPRSLINDAALFVATIISGTTSPSVLSNVSRLSLYEDANPFASMAVLARTAWLLVCFVHSAAFISTTNDTTRPPPPPPPFCCYDCSCCRSWRWQQCGVGGGSNGSVASHVGGSGADIPSSCGPVVLSLPIISFLSCWFLVVWLAVSCEKVSSMKPLQLSPKVLPIGQHHCPHATPAPSSVAMLWGPRKPC